jgi:hypothetical protein
MSLWDEIGAEIDALAKARGGPFQLYKPVLRIELYEHDDDVEVKVGRAKGASDVDLASVEVGRCKSLDEVVIRSASMSGRPYQECLLEALRNARKKAEVEVHEIPVESTRPPEERVAHALMHGARLDRGERISNVRIDRVEETPEGVRLETDLGSFVMKVSRA